MMKLDTEKPGLSALFIPYIATLILRLYQVTSPSSLLRGQTTGELHTWLNENADLIGIDKMSRASVINALKALAQREIVSYEEETCKGGCRRIYSIAMTPAEFEIHVTDTIVGKVSSIFEADWWRLGP